MKIQYVLSFSAIKLYLQYQHLHKKLPGLKVFVHFCLSDQLLHLSQLNTEPLPCGLLDMPSSKLTVLLCPEMKLLHLKMKINFVMKMSCLICKITQLT